MLVHFQYNGRNLQQGIRTGVEAAGFHVDDHWQKSPEAGRHLGSWSFVVSHCVSLFNVV
jgi:hypothetical protein